MCGYFPPPEPMSMEEAVMAAQTGIVTAKPASNLNASIRERIKMKVMKAKVRPVLFGVWLQYHGSLCHRSFSRFMPRFAPKHRIVFICRL